ncbi:Protein N-acetyltransferase, RimJ/RimL family [Butyrivibrio sp. Su6]|uniref:GNAT family N-acetyltransferase n=1 Tax=Butyrivibrio sp. Su6 TaxID=1520810 RepID=UPI00089F6F88|nr:GNAT family protein [Butyrivibrio sp. Su6]SEG22320.1 Protein N-acetyltransferase, RimJ/RimL family [Butyrivibrio sp. Su6]
MLVVGEKVALRLMTREDTDLIVKWRNNQRVRDNFVYREKFTNETHENWIKTKVETGEVVQLIICEKNNDNRPVGSVYFRDIDNTAHSAEYGIFIGEDDAIGKGYGNETAVLATEYARKELGLTKLILRVFTYNEVAIRSYEHAGFVKIKDLPLVECSDGEKSDMILMEQKI